MIRSTRMPPGDAANERVVIGEVDADGDAILSLKRDTITYSRATSIFERQDAFDAGVYIMRSIGEDLKPGLLVEC